MKADVLHAESSVVILMDLFIEHGLLNPQSEEHHKDVFKILLLIPLGNI